MAAGFNVKYLEYGAPAPSWPKLTGGVSTPPEILVSTEFDYPFDPELRASEIADWLLSMADTLHRSISMIITGPVKNFTFRQVTVKYDAAKVLLSTRVSMSVY